MDKYSELIPELKDWNNGEGIDVESWIGCSSLLLDFLNQGVVEYFPGRTGN